MKPLKLAFCLEKYFPFGGLQRDFLRIAKACQSRGHEIHVYTMKWEGAHEPGFKLHFIKAQGWQNHRRSASFDQQLQAALAGDKNDVVIGFNKLSHLDIYYAADVCYQGRMETRSFFSRLSPRYRTRCHLEASVFSKGMGTQVLLISPAQQATFMHYYQTEKERFYLLPPGISRDRIAPNNADEIRKNLRAHYQLSSHDFLLLMVGSGFQTKGVDRAIRGLAALPHALRRRTSLFIIGEDNAKPFERLARKLTVAHQVRFLGGRSDIPQFLLAADVLVHPAYHENTGTVLLEAVVAGLPVLTVAACGYAPYIESAQAGVVLPTPFDQQRYNAALETMLLSPERKFWQKNALAFAKKANIYDLPQQAANFIETYGFGK